MIQSIRPLLQASREEVEFRRMQIARRRIHTQRILVTGRQDPLGGANCGGVEQKLREEDGSINGRRTAIRILKHGSATDSFGSGIRCSLSFRLWSSRAPR